MSGELLDDVERDVLGGGEVLEVVVDDELAGDDIGKHGVVLVNAPVLQRPGGHGQADSTVGSAEGLGAVAGELGPLAVHGSLERELGSLADALEGGGDDGVGLAGLVDVDADDLAVVGGGGGGDGREDGAAAGEDDLSAVLIPAGDEGLQLGRSLEGSAVEEGVVHLDVQRGWCRRRRRRSRAWCSLP